ncbi:hypothetical protein M0R45_015514 [Rubus argutus]|uniref:Disease resistance R13L4/SHOC-2-like LRR domain-containing protein n=1 Tax=Rubus argutus TaxID=59490 RepID=A0AAW1XQX8_RUBAR
MHDLMLELALSTSEKEKFCSVYDGRESMEEIGVRRLSIQTTEGEIKVCTAPLASLIDPPLVTNEEEFLRVDALSSPPPQLLRLVLGGKLESVPRWFCSLHSLTYLNLHWTRLEEDLPPHIEALPNLQWLRLDNACAVEELCFSRGFVKLTHLELFNIPLLEKITIEQGVMPNLQLLRFYRCTELKTIPGGFEYLTQLETFYFNCTSEEFYESIVEGGVNHSKFRQRFPSMRM